MEFFFAKTQCRLIFFLLILAVSSHLKAYSYFSLQNNFGQNTLVEKNSSQTLLSTPVIWKNNQLSIYLDFDTSDAPTSIEGGWNSKAERALLQWNDVAETLTWFVSGSVYGLQACNELPSSDVAISAQWGKDFCGTPWGEDVLALTQLTYQINETAQGATAEIIAARLVVNNTNSWSVYRGPLHYLPNGETEHDFQRVVLHELGHVVGLTHPDENGQVVEALMNSREGDLDVPADDDIKGINALYPVLGLNSASVPEPNKSGGGALDQYFLILLFIFWGRRKLQKIT